MCSLSLAEVAAAAEMILEQDKIMDCENGDSGEEGEDGEEGEEGEEGEDGEEEVRERSLADSGYGGSEESTEQK